jgi:putative spermidine/putrescine transport system ATP-binding protein
LFVTHDQEEALSMADRVGVMRDGQLEQVAVPSELYADPASAFVAEFVGTMNRLPGEMDGDGRVRVLGTVLPVRGEPPAGQDSVDVLVRPEGLRMTSVPDGNGIVTIATFLGSLTRVSVLLPGEVTVLVDQPGAEAAARPPGTQVQVSVVESPVLVTARR